VAKREPRVSQEHLKSGQEKAKMHRRTATMHPRAAKMCPTAINPKGTKERKKSCPGAAKSGQDRTRSALEHPSRPPKSPQDRPPSGPKQPKGPRSRPRAAKSSQKHTKTLQNCSKSSLGHPENAQDQQKQHLPSSIPAANNSVNEQTAAPRTKQQPATINNRHNNSCDWLQFLTIS